MQHVVKHEPSFSTLQVALGPGEVLRAEASATVARSLGVRSVVELTPERGAGLGALVKAILVALVRKLLAAPSFFTRRVSAGNGGWIWLAPAMSGGVRHIPLRGEAIVLCPGAYLASAGDIALKVRWGGLRGALARGGAARVEASGTGDLWVAGYGAVDEIACDAATVVDYGHLVGFDPKLALRVRSAPAGAGRNATQAPLPGEGAVCELTGTGRVLTQSRSAGALAGWLAPLLPP